MRTFSALGLAAVALIAVGCMLAGSREPPSEVLVSALAGSAASSAPPRNGLEGKFSVRATVALALLGADSSDPALYSDGRMADPALVTLRDRAHVVTESDRRATRVRVRVPVAGVEFEAEEDSGVPARDLTLRLLRKFGNAGRVGGILDAGKQRVTLRFEETPWPPPPRPRSPSTSLATTPP